jgi:hypothetical protein
VRPHELTPRLPATLCGPGVSPSRASTYSTAPRPHRVQPYTQSHGSCVRACVAESDNTLVGSPALEAPAPASHDQLAEVYWTWLATGSSSGISGTSTRPAGGQARALRPQARARAWVWALVRVQARARYRLAYPQTRKQHNRPVYALELVSSQRSDAPLVSSQRSKPATRRSHARSSPCAPKGLCV